MKSSCRKPEENRKPRNFSPGAGQRSETGCSLISVPFYYMINYLLTVPENMTLLDFSGAVKKSNSRVTLHS